MNCDASNLKICAKLLFVFVAAVAGLQGCLLQRSFESSRPAQISSIATDLMLLVDQKPSQQEIYPILIDPDFRSFVGLVVENYTSAAGVETQVFFTRQFYGLPSMFLKALNDSERKLELAAFKPVLIDSSTANFAVAEEQMAQLRRASQLTDDQLRKTADHLSEYSKSHWMQLIKEKVDEISQ